MMIDAIPERTDEDNRTSFGTGTKQRPDFSSTEESRKNNLEKAIAGTAFQSPIKDDKIG